jgi:hypothetical protein
MYNLLQQNSWIKFTAQNRPNENTIEPNSKWGNAGQIEKIVARNSVLFWPDS